MTKLAEIIRAATSSRVSLSDVLRRCLVLAYELENEALKTWLEQELNGYQDAELLPEYRRVNITAKGLFVGSFGRSISDQPLASHILKPEHRHWAETAKLMQPIAAYEVATRTKDATTSAAIHWPASMTTFYQAKFFQDGDLILNRAWQEIPNSVFFGLVDIVRNNTLKFLLELQKELGSGNTKLSSLPKEKVAQMVTNNIFGGNVVIATHAQNFSQTNVSPNDKVGIVNALKHAGISESDATELIEAANQDKNDDPHAKTLGARTLAVIEKVGSAGLQAGVEIAKPVLTGLLSQYLGLPHA